MQLGEPMASPRQSNTDDLPDHIPIDAAMVPQTDPYKQSHRIKSPTAAAVLEQNAHSSSHDLSQHSLSPEKLGVTGYVRDVAGFVKDAAYQVIDHVEHSKKTPIHGSEKPLSPSTGAIEHDNNYSSQNIPIPDSHKKDHQHTTSLSPLHTQPRSPLADAVTGLFPGIDEHGHGCQHADTLRREMRTQHNGTIQPRMGGLSP
ncbi:hypothetical protein J3Q64DRAFT_1757219 [Phycomyces blakesleeanus]|uniref:Uncharacterized protein n=1 Tax=Phycomyces blakesleeanus TaxID=4837 RepID=A0ABR3AUS0_PHYBL